MIVILQDFNSSLLKLTEICWADDFGGHILTINNHNIIVFYLFNTVNKNTCEFKLQWTETYVGNKHIFCLIYAFTFFTMI